MSHTYGTFRTGPYVKNRLTRNNHKVNVLETVKCGLSIVVLLNCVWDICNFASNANDQLYYSRNNRGYKKHKFEVESHTHTRNLTIFISLAVRVRDRWCDSYIFQHVCMFIDLPGTFLCFFTTMVFEKPSDIDTFINFPKSQGGRRIIMAWSIVTSIFLYLCIKCVSDSINRYVEIYLLKSYYTYMS